MIYSNNFIWTWKWEVQELMVRARLAIVTLTNIDLSCLIRVFAVFKDPLRISVFSFFIDCIDFIDRRSARCDKIISFVVAEVLKQGSAPLHVILTLSKEIRLSF